MELGRYTYKMWFIEGKFYFTDLTTAYYEMTWISITNAMFAAIPNSIFVEYFNFVYYDLFLETTENSIEIFTIFNRENSDSSRFIEDIRSVVLFTILDDMFYYFHSNFCCKFSIDFIFSSKKVSYIQHISV